MKLFSPLFNLSKRQKLVLATIFLTLCLLASEIFSGVNHIFVGFVLSIVTTFVIFLILRRDMAGSFYYPLFILPFFYTLSVSVFYLLIPPRLISIILLTVFYAFGLYSLFLTQNIFAVSSVKTINLLRSARIVSFVITVLVHFLMVNIIFSLRLPVYVTPILIGLIGGLLNMQSLWVYILEKTQVKELITYSAIIGMLLMQLSFVLVIWPIDASIYSIFLTGIFYTYSGLSHAWFEKRLFKGVLWEYIWVGFLSIFILLAFAKWGI
ncbi:MAG TPA: hypothetical protein PLD54_01825 [Candidatus Levybacteria bacterium]|nr:hypothetical protein [Candidatus Levybacteria bacterium]